MTQPIATIWEFKTRNFCVRMTAEEEYDLDLSFDDTGEVAEKIENGEYVAFCAQCSVYWRGAEVGTKYLGNCIYESFDAFRDHIGLRDKSRANAAGYGSYFADMVGEAIAEARKLMCNAPKMRCA